MGGKGQRRREKNYKAAHGDCGRLPPPPKPTQIDAIPSKLRRLIDFATATATSTATAAAANAKIKKMKNNGEKNQSYDEHKDGDDQTFRDMKKTKKRKRNQVKDLRFDTTKEEGSYGLKKKERKNKYLEAKKNKHNKKAKIGEGQEFPSHEVIKFGDVVDAPPKLLAVPKRFKNVQDASHERLRLQAVEAYRNRKGWGSRPGIILPTRSISDPSV